ncbi:LysR family transcriptional regulator [Bordetella petrii]|uniref:LysR family transcriptional regulator n=1 Tax=Bordetella petrii TaxID=94624 RepID=UPI001E43CA17|nr:LysR family transcriptional regulator [Bordetella petrii]MCD0505020.1 LysR family transcriptional regulator [Bordetella petrii]
MESHPVQLNDIALFVEVARRKSFSVAARALGMPTSTLSRRIGQLERLIGLRLINRNTRRLELTNAGNAYLQRCQGLIDDARLAHEQLLALSASPQGRLSISIPYSMAIWLLPEALKEFTDRYPDLECEFDLNQKAVENSQGGPFDIALRFGSDHEPLHTSAAEDPAVRKITSLDGYLYASADYLQEHGEPLQPADLSNHECLRTTMDLDDSAWTLHHGKQLERVPVRGAIAGNNISVIGTLSGLGLGITRLPNCRALAPIIGRNSLRRILPGWTSAPLSVYAVFPSPVQPAKTRAFMDFIRPWLDPAE